MQFNFNTYRQRTDKHGFTRDFKENVAEKYDKNRQLTASALTPKGNLKRISVNENWEYFKAKQRALLSAPEAGQIYAQRKIDVELFFWGSLSTVVGNLFICESDDVDIKTTQGGFTI